LVIEILWAVHSGPVGLAGEFARILTN